MTVDDFLFRIGNDNTPLDWNQAPEPVEITVRPSEGMGGSDRITIIWEDYEADENGQSTGGIGKQWLQVTVLATANTGLAIEDVHYWGNAVGESGLNPDNAQVNATDELAARFNQHNIIDPAPIDDFVDFNRDRFVNATDELIARFNGTSLLTTLKLITVPAAGSSVQVIDVLVSSDRSGTARGHLASSLASAHGDPTQNSTKQVFLRQHRDQVLSFRTVGEALSEDVETGSQWIIFGKAIDGQLADESSSRSSQSSTSGSPGSHSIPTRFSERTPDAGGGILVDVLMKAYISEDRFNEQANCVTLVKHGDVGQSLGDLNRQHGHVIRVPSMTGP